MSQMKITELAELTREQVLGGPRPGGVLRFRTPWCRWRDTAPLLGPWHACLCHLKYLLPVIEAKLQESCRFRIDSQWLSSICPHSEWLNGALLPSEQWSELSLVARVRVELCSSRFKVNIKSSNTPVNACRFLSKGLPHSSSENYGVFEECWFGLFLLLTAPAATTQNKWFSLKKYGGNPNVHRPWY